MGLLTEEDKKFKSESHYEGIKKFFNEEAIKRGNKSLFSWPWRNIFAKREKSGMCVNACKTLNPSSMEEFYEKGWTVNPKMHPDEIEKIASGLLSHCKATDIPLSKAYDLVVCHNFVETYRGVNREKELIKILVENGWEILPSTDEDDWKLGADIIARKNGVTVYVQVKCTSFLFGPRPDCVEDRRKVFYQFIPEQIKRNNGVKPKFIWVFYDYNTYDWIYNPIKNNYRWDFEEIVDYNTPKCSLRKDFVKYFDAENTEGNRTTYISF